METETSRKRIIKKIAGIFLVVLLILTFFSNTIMNYSLPEVATEPVTTGTVSSKVRGQGNVETNSDYEVTVSGARTVKEVKVEVGDTVKKDDVLFTFEEGENTELKEAQDTLEQMELDYAKSLLKSMPDYTTDNMDIADAKEALEEAIKAKEKATSNDKALNAAKKEAARTKQKVEEKQKKVDTLQEKINAYGEVGSYDAAKEQVEADTRELASLKTELADLKEDLEAAKAEGEDTKILERSIRDKELQISNKELDLKTAQATAESLKTISTTYNQLKSDLDKETKELAALQKTLEEQNAKVEELGGATTLEAAKADVKAKQDSLDRLLIALQKRKEEDSLSQQSEAMDLKAAQDKIEEQKQKVAKIQNSSDLTEIRAKEDGVIASVDAKAGDNITAETPIAKIQLLESGYLVRFTVTKAQSKLIKVGNEAKVENVWSDDVTATVKSIKADPENPNQNMIVTFDVKGDVDAGQNLALSVGEKSNRYDAVVPNNAIKEDSKGKFVLVVKVKGTPLGNRYTVKRADVEVLASDDNSSGVSGGVYESDNVVTNSSKPLEEGMQVRLVE
ncbi:MAG: HlyD family efflux transporter periplasmic adaptor subunit [Lachnospiraceae bacterium]|nr:HlyD family efflux transporter periplasmic adaptor subunit [Lachnospiraceae bacterium]